MKQQQQQQQEEDETTSDPPCFVDLPPLHPPLHPLPSIYLFIYLSIYLSISSLRLYNGLVERCFRDCVDDFRSKNLSKDEEKVRRCAAFLAFLVKARRSIGSGRQHPSVHTTIQHTLLLCAVRAKVLRKVYERVGAHWSALPGAVPSASLLFHHHK